MLPGWSASQYISDSYQRVPSRLPFSTRRPTLWSCIFYSYNLVIHFESPEFQDFCSLCQRIFRSSIFSRQLSDWIITNGSDDRFHISVFNVRFRFLKEAGTFVNLLTEITGPLASNGKNLLLCCFWHRISTTKDEIKRHAKSPYLPLRYWQLRMNCTFNALLIRQSDSGACTRLRKPTCVKAKGGHNKTNSASSSESYCCL